MARNELKVVKEKRKVRIMVGELREYIIDLKDIYTNYVERGALGITTTDLLFGGKKGEEKRGL